MRPQNDEGWILAEALVAALIGAAALAASITLTRLAEDIARATQARSHLIAIATEVLEEARTNPAFPTYGEVEAPRAAWRIQRETLPSIHPWQPQITTLKVTVISADRHHKTYALATRFAQGRLNE